MLRNNHGWGLKEMLFLSAILLFFVLVIALLVSQLYGSTGSSSSKKPSEYAKVEKKLSNAAKKYYRENSDSDYILADDLILEEYLSLKDMTVDRDICDGYVLVDNNSFEPFISCENYETEGY